MMLDHALFPALMQQIKGLAANVFARCRDEAFGSSGICKMEVHP
jgi:hypothetical protein